MPVSNNCTTWPSCPLISTHTRTTTRLHGESSKGKIPQSNTEKLRYYCSANKSVDTDRLQSTANDRKDGIRIKHD